MSDLVATPRTYATYEPMPRQKLFHSIQAWGPKMMKGAIGGMDGGKTTACEQELIELCMREPDGQSVAVRKDMEGEGEVSVLQDLRRLLLPGGFASWSSDKYFLFANAHKLYVLQGKEWEKFGSVEFCNAYLMEAHELDWKIPETLLARLRHPAGRIDGRPYYRLLFDARGVTSHHWVNTQFIEKGWNVDDGEAKRATVQNPNFVYVKWKTSDNIRRGSWYEDELRREHANDPLWIKVMVEGEIGLDIEGTPVFADSWDPDVHVFDRIEEDTSLAVLRGWDPGFRAPGLVYAQYTRSGRFLVLGDIAPLNTNTDSMIKLATAYQSERFPGRSYEGYRDFCDRMADRVDSAATYKDIEQIEEKLKTYCTYRYAQVETGLNLIRRLQRETVRVNGKNVPRFGVDRSAATVLSAMGGGYHYQKNQAAGPIKGGPYTAVIDAIRYIAQEIVEEQDSGGAVVRPPVDRWGGSGGFGGLGDLSDGEASFGKV